VAVGFMLLSAAEEEVGERHKEAALLDPLTGIGNRRGFSEEVGRMIARGARSGTRTALLLVDLDRFKEINDRWGHPVGDSLLRALGETMAGAVRSGDVIGRLGGDEFAVALADARVDQAMILAERIRSAVAATRIDEKRGDIRCTVSIGVASLRPGASLETLFGDADAALYRAKARGGDRVESAPEPPAQEPGRPPQRGVTTVQTAT
jgi:diguanylate cyclase (GGDEF)-like protein